MTPHTLSRSGDTPLNFQGDLICGSPGSRQGGVKQVRYHDLAIFRDDLGRYIVQIRYVTSWSGESGHELVQPVCTLGEVVAFCRAYDPTSHLHPRPIYLGAPDRYATWLDHMRESLRTRYARQVRTIVCDMQQITMFT